jgi:hypothetical protein
MGAIFFYIFIFFVGYYGSNVLNMLTVRPIVTNRFIAALFPVYGIAIAHAYMIVSRPLPQGKDVSVEFALLEFVALPLVVVTMLAVYMMWNSKGSQEEQTGSSTSDDVGGDAEPSETAIEQPEHQSTAASPETTEPAAEKEETKKP